MLLTDARRKARTNANGELVPLEKQDRSLWDREQIIEGVRLLSANLPKGLVGQYQLQAAIAAVYDVGACRGSRNSDRTVSDRSEQNRQPA